MKREITFRLANYDATPVQYTDAHPIYGNDFAINVEKESGQVFYREKLSDNLTYNGKLAESNLLFMCLHFFEESLWGFVMCL